MEDDSVPAVVWHHHETLLGLKLRGDQKYRTRNKADVWVPEIAPRKSPPGGTSLTKEDHRIIPGTNTITHTAAGRITLNKSPQARVSVRTLSNDRRRQSHWSCSKGDTTSMSATPTWDAVAVYT